MMKIKRYVLAGGMALVLAGCSSLSSHKPDYAEAARLYRLAAEQGDAEAQSNLGWMYYKGQGVIQDYAEAARLYRLAAEQGNAWAQFNLGWLYQQGQGVIQDYRTAHVWLNIAATNGHWSAAWARDQVAEYLSLTNLAKAQDAAQQCLESNYQNCP